MSALTLERVSASNRKIPADEVIYAALKAGRDHFEIAAEHGGTPALILAHIKRKGWDKGAPLELATRVWPSRDQFAAWIDEGLTYFEMAGATGFYCDTIRQRLKLIGLWDAYQARRQKAVAAVRQGTGPVSDARRVVLDGITRPDGTVIPGPVSLARVSMIAKWQGRPGWEKDDERGQGSC